MGLGLGNIGIGIGMGIGIGQGSALARASSATQMGEMIESQVASMVLTEGVMVKSATRSTSTTTTTSIITTTSTTTTSPSLVATGFPEAEAEGASSGNKRERTTSAGSTRLRGMLARRPDDSTIISMSMARSGEGTVTAGHSHVYGPGEAQAKGNTTAKQGRKGLDKKTNKRMSMELAEARAADQGRLIMA